MNSRDEIYRDNLRRRDEEIARLRSELAYVRHEREVDRARLIRLEEDLKWHAIHTSG